MAALRRTPTPHRHVLLADDYPDAADSLAEVLRLLGHEVTVAYDGRAALKAARTCPPDVVICETRLPGLSGYALAKTLHAERKNVRLIALSANDCADDVKTAIEAGFDAYFAKPADLEKIEQLLL